MPEVTVMLGERHLRLTRAEAEQLHDLLVQLNLVLLALQSELTRVLQAESGPQNVLVDEEMRQGLLLCLDASWTESELAEGLQRLRQAARVPLAPRPEY